MTPDLLDATPDAAEGQEESSSRAARSLQHLAFGIKYVADGISAYEILAEPVPPDVKQASKLLLDWVGERAHAAQPGGELPVALEAARAAEFQARKEYSDFAADLASSADKLKSLLQNCDKAHADVMSTTTAILTGLLPIISP